MPLPLLRREWRCRVGIVREPRHEGVAKASGSLLIARAQRRQSLAKGGRGTAGGAPSGGAAVAVARQWVAFYQGGSYPGHLPLEPRSAGLRSVAKTMTGTVAMALCDGYLAWLFVAWPQQLHTFIPADDKDYYW